MTEIQNKFPGKDVTPEDLETKFPLVAKKSPEHVSRFEVAGVVFGGPTVPIMAGPNMVESEELIVDIAKNVQKLGAHFLRGGAFKPLTFPYRSAKYNETREKGIEWLGEAKRATGLPVITEVMEERYLPLVCEVADIIQIGSRNMQNYPLLRALGKVNKPVLLKRGMSSTVEEWLLAAEYILVGGNEKVILCERGIRTFENATRNTLDLGALALVKRLSHLPVIVDPSQATGIRDLVQPMSMAAIAAGADGLIIEVHNQPKEALSDGDQSLYLDQFRDMLQPLQQVAGVMNRTFDFQKDRVGDTVL